MRDRIDIARLLLQRGADPSINNSMGFTPRQQAGFVKNTEPNELLNEFEAKKAKQD